MQELFWLKLGVQHMNLDQKKGLKIKTLEGIKSESIRCHKKGMTLDQILAPSYRNKDFMFVLSHLGIDKNELEKIVKEYISEYEHANRIS